MRTKYAEGSEKGQALQGLAASRNELQTLSSLVSRAKLQGLLGQSYGGARDLYNKLGWEKDPQYSHFRDRYTRQEVAQRVVEAPVDATWNGSVTLTEAKGKGKDSAFKKAWKELDQDVALINKVVRADTVSGIGQYAILLLGFDDIGDGEDLTKSVAGTDNKLMFAQPYSQENATIKKLVADTTDPRFGLPEMYEINTNIANLEQAQTTETKQVHWSRVIHIAEGLLEDNIFGKPRLLAIYNMLQNLELVAGSSGEMFWRGAFPGLMFEADKEADMNTEVIADLKVEIDKYIHGLRRSLRLQGINVKELTGQVSSPLEHIKAYITLISAGTGIPVRILTGSERGELASEQDERNWNSRVEERRVDYAEPMILRQLVDRLILFGVLPTPTDGYTVLWSPLAILDEKTAAQVAKMKTEAIAAYASALGADQVLPVNMFLEKILGFTPDEVEEIMSITKDLEEEIADEPVAEEEVPVIPGDGGNGGGAGAEA